ncbi:MAG: twin transmembrane helix small protein [Candidatus Berkiellales bacterium]
MDWIFKDFIFVLMIGIVIALGSGLYFMLFGKRGSESTAKALTARIGLSLVLFTMLFIAFAMGWIKPHGLYPIANKQKQIETATPHPQNANTTPPPRNQNDVPD